jgi:hypothetical protein
MGIAKVKSHADDDDTIRVRKRVRDASEIGRVRPFAFAAPGHKSRAAGTIPSNDTLRACQRSSENVSF